VAQKTQANDTSFDHVEEGRFIAEFSKHSSAGKVLSENQRFESGSDQNLKPQTAKYKIKTGKKNTIVDLIDSTSVDEDVIWESLKENLIHPTTVQSYSTKVASIERPYQGIKLLYQHA